MNDILIEEKNTKEPYIKELTSDKVINITGESGSGKTYYSSKYKDNEDYIVVDTDEIFGRFENSNGVNRDLGIMFRSKYDILPDVVKDFDLIYKDILDYFKDSDKTIVIDSAQFRNLNDINLLKGTVIVMRTSIDECFNKCVVRWTKNNPCATEEDLKKYEDKKKGMYEWYHNLNDFITKLENFNKN